MSLKKQLQQIRGHKHRPHHILGVSFGQSVCDKPNGLQMINNCMQEFGLKKNAKLLGRTRKELKITVIRTFSLAPLYESTCFSVSEVKFGWVSKISISPLDAAPGTWGTWDSMS